MYGRRKKLMTILLLLVLIAASALAGSYVFRIENEDNVTFVGYKTYTPHELFSSSGISLPFNILMLDKDQIKNTLESNQDLYLKVLNVERVFPNKIVIKIQELKECAQVAYVDNQYMTVDQNGCMARLHETDPGLTVITGVGGLCKYEKGKQLLSQDGQKMEDAATVIKALDELGIGAQVKSVDVADHYAIVLDTAYGYKVIVGTPTDLGYKLGSVLPSIIDELQKRGDTTGSINLSVKGKWTYSK